MDILSANKIAGALAEKTRQNKIVWWPEPTHGKGVTYGAVLGTKYVAYIRKVEDGNVT